ncbi:hypothetical protein S40293_10238 [Stachybotrys chartarum IBT 40293]|nr:hypothetical protein S40293_10238 [Stachybotrys chartarum IBT 40293]
MFLNKAPNALKN